MREYKVLALEGRNNADYETQLNKTSSEGWKFLSTMGKSNMTLIFYRVVKVREVVDEDDD